MRKSPLRYCHHKFFDCASQIRRAQVPLPQMQVILPLGEWYSPLTSCASALTLLSIWASVRLVMGVMRDTTDIESLGVLLRGLGSLPPFPHLVGVNMSPIDILQCGAPGDMCPLSGVCPPTATATPRAAEAGRDLPRWTGRWLPPHTVAMPLKPAGIHPYIHTYIHTYRHTYIHTYVHTYIHTDRQPYIQRLIHIQRQIHIHTYVHTYIHT